MEPKVYDSPIAEMEKLANSFTYHAPKPDQLPRYEDLRERGHELAMAIARSVPPSRERSLAITRLEEVIMWANKGIACNEN